MNTDNGEQILFSKPPNVIILTTTGSEMTLEHPSDDELTITGAIYSGTTKVRNSGLGPDPDLSAKSGPE